MNTTRKIELALLHKQRLERLAMRESTSDEETKACLFACRLIDGIVSALVGGR